MPILARFPNRQFGSAARHRTAFSKRFARHGRIDVKFGYFTGPLDYYAVLIIFLSSLFSILLTLHFAVSAT